MCADSPPPTATRAARSSHPTANGLPLPPTTTATPTCSSFPRSAVPHADSPTILRRTLPRVSHPTASRCSSPQDATRGPAASVSSLASLLRVAWTRSSPFRTLHRVRGRPMAVASRTIRSRARLPSGSAIAAAVTRSSGSTQTVRMQLRPFRSPPRAPMTWTPCGSATRCSSGPTATASSTSGATTSSRSSCAKSRGTLTSR